MQKSSNLWKFQTILKNPTFVKVIKVIHFRKISEGINFDWLMFAFNLVTNIQTAMESDNEGNKLLS